MAIRKDVAVIENVSTYFVFYFYFFSGRFVHLVDLKCTSGTDCIIFHRRIAGSQVYGRKELIL